MNSMTRIVIERPVEHVFRWMVQPSHLVQLVTLDPSKDFIGDEPIPAEHSEEVARMRRFQEQATSEIEIQQLSDPTLRPGTIFRYRLGVRSQLEEFPAWRIHAAGSITIQKSTPPTYFAFMTTREISSSAHAHHRLTFQAQQGNTLMTYQQSTRLGAIQFLIASVFVPKVLTFGNRWMQRQLFHLKTQMEGEID